MLSLGKVAKIRHKRLVEGQSIRSIAQDLGVSRNTVRKVLRSGAREHVYERRSSVQPRPKLGDHVGELETLLEGNGKRRRRDQLNTKQIWQHLCDLGCEASYEAVRRHVRDWEHRHGCGLAGAHVPLSFEPGEAYQFDWSHEQVLIGGMPVTVKVAQFILCYSRMPFIRCYPRESQEMVFDAHDRAFAAFDGQCERGIYDNMSTAVKSVLRGREREINPQFLKMCSHHLVKPEFCTPRSGWEKGRIERQIGTLRNRLFRPRPRSGTLDCLNGWIAQECLRHAREHPHPGMPERSIHEVFAGEEQRCLAPSVGPFAGWRSQHASVSPTCMVRFDNNRYSVEARAVGRPVEIRGYAELVEIMLGGELVGSHRRRFGRNRQVYDITHFIPILERKPGALRNGAPFKAGLLPGPLAQVKERLGRLEDGDRQMVDILLEARHRGLDAVSAACAEALEAGLCSSDVILNILARRCERTASAQVETPQGLKLGCEPQADCKRYDSLLKGKMDDQI